HFEWLSAPRAFVGNKQVEGILTQRMRLLPKDMSGRQNVVPVEGATHTIRADMAINALGFEPEELPTLWNEPALTLSAHGTVQVETKSLMTSLPGVFAAGDIVRGA